MQCLLRRHLRSGIALLLTAFAAGCRGEQAVLAPIGVEAERVALLSIVLFAGGAAILLLVLVFTAVAAVGRGPLRERLARESTILAGGIVFPAVVLSLLLGYGFLVTRAGGSTTPSAAADPLRISVIGEQWWWRVIYEDQDGGVFESANELRIPVGRPVEVALTSADVIHSFWVPNLAGKVDMIPGRTTRITLEALREGVSRGQCAEYCGGAHALMAFHVIALQPEAFIAWLAHEARPAAPPASSEAERGQILFLSAGCGSCHTIRGTPADGRIGPDLTHVGARQWIAAGTLVNDAQSLAEWVARNQHIKPENRMPPFAVFSEAERAALGSYLAGLE
jgi:cytochrome c oxidase subunit 2